MTYLADVNVLLAFTTVGHVHHAAAVEWLDESDTNDVVICRTVQKGFLRLLTNRHVMGENVLSAARAWDVYDTVLQDSRMRFASEPAGLEQAWRAATQRHHTGPNFWTDAYLVAFASAAGFVLLTFDKALAAHRGARTRLLA